MKTLITFTTFTFLFSPLITSYNLSEASPSKQDRDVHMNIFFKGTSKKIISLKRRRKIKVNKSKNLLIEDLHNSKQLETVFYATELDQMTDFVWFRDSGIRVNVALYNVNIIPVYSDVYHAASDNDFVMKHFDRFRPTFQRATQKFCRHPIPDFYNVTLEIFRDRETSARIETSVDDHGERHSTLIRKVNEACHQRIPQVVLQSGSNVLLCTDETHLLTKIFKMNSTRPSISATNPSFRSCIEDWNTCSSCAQNTQKCFATTNNAELKLDMSCCMITCLSMDSCRSRYKTECDMETQLDCVKGDAYRYSLLPIFEHPNKEIHCHLKHKPLKILYSLSYHLSLPASIETSSIKHQVSWFSTGHPPKSFHQLDFLNIEFESSNPPHEEIILTIHQQSSSSSSSSEFKYLVKPLLRLSTNPSLQSFVVNSHGNLRDTFVTSLQFYPPFSYSTSSWSGSCKRNINQIFPLQSSRVVSADVIQSRRFGSSFEYLIIDRDKSPHLRLYLPGNSSVLRSWFQNVTSKLLWFETNISIVDRYLTIQLNGEVSQCPSYLEFTGFDLSESEELFKWDLLITCPPLFDFVAYNVTLTTIKSDKMLEFILDDLHYEHKVIHTIMSRDLRDYTANYSSTDSLNNFPKGDSLHNFGLIFVVLVAVFIFLVFCFSLLLFNRFSGRNTSSKGDFLHRRNTYNIPSLCLSSQGNPCTSHEDGEKIQRGLNSPFVISFKLLVACFIIAKVIYNIVFTFTVITLLLFAWINEKIASDQAIDCLRVWRANDFWKIFERFGGCLENSLVVQERLQSCDAYMEAIINFVKKDFQEFYASADESKFINEIHNISSFNVIKNIYVLVSEWQELFKSHKNFEYLFNDSIFKMFNNQWFLYSKFLDSKVAESKLKEEFYSSINLKFYFENLKMLTKHLKWGVKTLLKLKLPFVTNVSCLPGMTGANLKVVNLSKYFVSNEYFQANKVLLRKVTQPPDRSAICGQSNDDNDWLLNLQSVFIILFLLSDTLLVVQRFTNLFLFSRDAKHILTNNHSTFNSSYRVEESSHKVTSIPKKRLQKMGHYRSMSSSLYRLNSSSCHLNQNITPRVKILKPLHFNRKANSRKFVMMGFWSFLILSIIVVLKEFASSLMTPFREAIPYFEPLISNLFSSNLSFMKNSLTTFDFVFDLQQLQVLCQFSELNRLANQINHRDNCKLEIFSCFDNNEPQISMEDGVMPKNFHIDNFEKITAFLNSSLDVVMFVVTFFVLSTTLATIAHLSFDHFAKSLQRSTTDPLTDNELQDKLSDTFQDQENESKAPSPESCGGNRERMIAKQLTMRLLKHCKFSETKV